MNNDLHAALSAHAAASAERLNNVGNLLRTLLHEVSRRPQPFALDGANNLLLTSKEARGVVKFLHNPTANNLTITLVDGSNASQLPEFSSTLAPGESRFVHVVFRTGLYCVAGAGAVIDGEYDA